MTVSIGKSQSTRYLASEFRQDPVTGNWVLIAKARADRPGIKVSSKNEEDQIETCPFENPKESGNDDPVLINYSNNNKDWSLQVIPNKYPAVSGGGHPLIHKIGPYRVEEGLGYHEVIITRDHDKHIGMMRTEGVKEVLAAYRDRYLALSGKECVKYISIFHNHGRKAGASLTHPHSQLMAIPVLPADVRRNLRGSRAFRDKHNKCAHCDMIAWDIKDGQRVVFENDSFISVCPFISRGAYEIRVYPKDHTAYFEQIRDKGIGLLAETFKESLSLIFKKLNNPAYNFYLHTAPVRGKSEADRYDYYHWHLEVRPRIETGAGFELSTGVEISIMEPERAAEFLRS